MSLRASIFQAWRSLRLAATLALGAGLATVWAAGAAPDEIIRPSAGSRGEAPAAAPGSGIGAYTLVGVLLLAAGGFWLVRRGRQDGPAGRRTGRLAVEETKSLGNRQFLVVAAYGDRRFLIGVCPGKIDLIAPLDREPPAS